jgi:hypothetical protein
MSNFAYACCCESQSCEDCAASNTCYDTSYVIPAIDIIYTFSRNAANLRPCEQCGQSCGFAEYTITARVLAQDLVVQRVSPAGLPCCYSWRGQVDVEYSLELSVTRRCVGTNCPRVWLDSWSGTNTVDACIDVVCLGCGNFEACGKTWTQERVWAHTLRVCDFDVTCSGDRNGLIGVNPSDPSTLACLLYTTDCDPQVAEPCVDCSVPGRLWCAGGAVTYYSDGGPLDAVGTLRCKGWKANALCGEDCDVHQNWTQVGPWSASFLEECDQGGILKQCEGYSGAQYPTRGFGAQIDGWLNSDCGSVDESVTAFCFDVDYLQAGCSGQGWVYT